MIDYISLIKVGPHVKFILLIKYVSGYVLRQISNYTDTPPRFANCLFDMTLKIKLCSAFLITTSFPKVKGGCLALLVEKMTSSVLSELKCILHCHAHNRTDSRSLFRSSEVLFSSVTAEYRDVSSANVLTSHVTFSTRSFM